MKTLENQFNYIEWLTIEIQNHALQFNEYKSNGVNSVPIDNYLDLLDAVLEHVDYIKNNIVNESEIKVKNLREQIDKLLDNLNKIRSKDVNK